MIIDSKQSNVQVLGDIKEFKTSINPKDLEFVTTLLSSNLYSHPEQSFIREIVSNAWDSHVEAGNTDTPVIIRLRRIAYKDYEVTIRDFGTGLSPERFSDVYCNIGSSTKRESNDFHGGFGIGKYSSLACSKTVHITSYYNGTAYYYIMVKDGNAITINLVLEKPTEENNGVEVTIKNIYDINKYEKALDYIIFFPNVYVENYPDFHETKIKRFKNFACASKRIDHKLLLGNVLYPLNDSVLSDETKRLADKFLWSGIVVKFDIGELNITPNRESIIYTSDTVAIIEQRIKDAIAELDSLINGLVDSDYTDLYEYYKAIKNEYRFDPIDNTFGLAYFNKRTGYVTKRDPNKITFKGSLNMLVPAQNYLNAFFHCKIPNLRGVFFRDKFYTGKVPYRAEERTVISWVNIIMVKGVSRISSYIKSYLEDKYSDCAIMAEITKEEFIYYVRDNIYDLKTASKAEYVFNEMWEYFINHVKIVDITKDEEYAKYVQDIKDSAVKTFTPNEFILYTYNTCRYRSKHHFSTLDSCIHYIKKKEKGIILCDLQEPDIWFDIAKVKGYEVIRAKKELVAYINDLNLDCIVNKQWCLEEDPLIKKLKPINDILIPYLNVKSIPPGLIDSIPKTKRDEFKALLKIRNTFDDEGLYLAQASKCPTSDPYIEKLCKELIDYCDKYISILDEFNIVISHYNDDAIVGQLILKQKLYRISYELYKKVQNNKLLKVLCRK